MVNDPITIERLERAVLAVAYVVVRHGPMYAPLLESLERDLDELRRRDDPVARARRILEAHAIAPERPALSAAARAPLPRSAEC